MCTTHKSNFNLALFNCTRQWYMKANSLLIAMPVHSAYDILKLHTEFIRFPTSCASQIS